MRMILGGSAGSGKSTWQVHVLREAAIKGRTVVLQFRNCAILFHRSASSPPGIDCCAAVALLMHSEGSTLKMVLLT